MPVEVEVRTFIDDYDTWKHFFDEHAELVSDDYQKTVYFDCDEDLRIQKSQESSKVWLKKGALHDDSREELEIQFDVDDFETAKDLFEYLGYTTDIKWFRKRRKYRWKDITVCLDKTEGFGEVLEFEKMTDETNKEEIYTMMKEEMKSLGVDISTDEEFEERYQYYKENWRDLI